MDINLQYDNDRFFAEDEHGEIIAEIMFPKISDNTIDIRRTFVHPSLRGQGVADKMMQAVVSKIQSEHLRVVTSCSYAAKWFSNHPELSSLTGG